jgi:hypothetical protein
MGVVRAYRFYRAVFYYLAISNRTGGRKIHASDRILESNSWQFCSRAAHPCVKYLDISISLERIAWSDVSVLHAVRGVSNLTIMWRHEHLTALGLVPSAFVKISLTTLSY